MLMGSVRKFAWLVAVAAVIAVLLPPRTAEAIGDTSVEAIADAGSPSSLVLTDVGNPVVGFGASVAECADRFCADPVISSVPLEGTIAYDSNGRPAASVERLSHARAIRGLEFTRCSDSQCSSSTTQAIESVSVGNFDIVLDRDGRAVIAYVVSATRNLRVIRCENLDCSASTNERIRSDAWTVSLTLDSSDMPVMAFTQGDDQDVQVARCLDRTCTGNSARPIDPGVSAFRGTTIVLDANDNPLVGYLTSFPIEDARLAICADQACTSSTVRVIDRAAAVPDIVLDSSDRPAISYAGIAGDLRLARCDDVSCSTWSTESIDGGASSTRLAIGGDDLPVIAYFVFGRELRVARCVNPTCMTTNRDFDIPELGRYTLQSVETGRYLDADPTGNVDTSRLPMADDQWDLTLRAQGGFHPYRIRNALHETFVGEGRWRIEPNGDGSVYVRRGGDPFPDFGPLYLSTEGTSVVGESFQNADRWVFVPVEIPDLDGQRIALQSVLTGRWLDADGTGDVNQSVQRLADDVWLVEQVDDLGVFLVNEVTGRYLDGDGQIAVDTSVNPDVDDVWQLQRQNGLLTLTNAEFGDNLAARGIDNGFDVVRLDASSPGTQWRVTILPADQ